MGICTMAVIMGVGASWDTVNGGEVRARVELREGVGVEVGGWVRVGKGVCEWEWGVTRTMVTRKENGGKLRE